MGDGYDPFAERLENKDAITDTESLIHVLKAAVGTGILSMPIAFMYSGLLLGTFAAFLTSLLCGHCAYVLIEKMGDGYDPFAERLENKDAITDTESLIHVLKAAVGTGILSMPIAFMYSGLLLGTFAAFLTSLLCGHCAYVLVQCAHKIYYKEKTSKMTYAELTEKVFMHGPESVHGCAGFAKFVVIFGLFLTYFGTLSVYVVFVARNFQQVLEHWTGETYGIRMLISALMLPLILLVWIPNLKSLAPVSLIGNIFMWLALGITCSYLVVDLPSMDDRDKVKLSGLPSHFAINIFAVQCIGMILPLENSMRTPTHFLGIFGVLSMGLFGSALLCAALGFMGYWKYGSETEETITLNLPVEEFPAQLVVLLVALVIFFTFALQFTVCLEIAWYYLQDNFTARPLLGHYIVRTILAVSSVLVAIAVPTIAPFMGLIGSFCFSILGIIMPVIFDIVLRFEYGFGPGYCALWKDIFIICFGMFALILGTYTSILDIAKLYE